MKKKSSLTSVERNSYDIRWNLADAHARQRQTSSEKERIYSRFGDLFSEAENLGYHELETQALCAYLDSINQVTRPKKFFSIYSSSVSMMIVARLIRENNRSVQLVVPTFDNIPDLLKAEKVKLFPRPENMPLVPASKMRGRKKRVIFEVSPNNPTGNFISAKALRELAEYCAANDVWLVLDQTFKAQVSESCFDHYAILDASGVEYIIIEDTGKLWPTLDMKVSFLVASPRLADLLEPIVDDVLLNVSPFILALVKAYSQLSQENEYLFVRSLVRDNREFLRDSLGRSAAPIRVQYPDSMVSVEMLSLTNSVTLKKATDFLASNQIQVLGVDSFYWDGTTPGNQLRISLARDRDYFRESFSALLELLSQLAGS
jgi:aspartate/methionine/tyrosine aminotransferase